MLVASDYPFLNLMWTILIVFMWIIWIMLLFYILADVFRRHDAGGGKKALWMIFVILAAVPRRARLRDRQRPAAWPSAT